MESSVSYNAVLVVKSVVLLSASITGLGRDGGELTAAILIGPFVRFDGPVGTYIDDRGGVAGEPEQE